MGLNTYPSNPFPPSTDGMDADALEAEVGKLKSGLTNLDTEVNGDATVYPYADVITIEDAVPSNLADCSVKIEPVQDLHGQSAPYVGGAGKNKLPLVLADIKSINTEGSWSGNTYTKDNATFIVGVDDANNVLSITGTGNGSFGTYIYLKFTLAAGSYVLSSGFTEVQGTNDTYLHDGTSVIARGNAGTPGTNFTLESDTSVTWYFRVGSNSTYVCTPMIRLATETDATFAPYTNVCPISGHTEASVTVADDAENPTVTKTYTIALGDTIYGGTVDFDSGVMTVTMAQIASYDGETIGEPWISDRDVYEEGTTPTTGAQVVYTLSTPTTIQLTPQQIQLLKGQNTLTASTGQISVTANGVSGAIGQVQEQVNGIVADLAEQLPTAPTTDGTYTLTVTVADGTPTYSWVSGS